MNEIPKPEILLDVSNRFLQDLLLASLDRSSRNLKTAKIAWDEAVQEQAMAIAARYFLDHRLEILEMARKTLELKAKMQFPKTG